MKSVYMMGIGGIAMGTLATMLKERGYEVAGSDQNLYPPMSTHLESLRIPLCLGYDARNLSKFSPDMVVIGNVIRRENPEAQFVLEHGLPYLSMPEAISRFFLRDHKSIVAAGTHGKSTTSSLLAWVLTHGGLDPSAFIGAFINNWERSYRLGRGPYMVLEGDEYDTAFFDKGPKFFHYQPYIGILSSIEFDHADIFTDFQAVIEAFRGFVHRIPRDGFLVVNADDPTCLALSRECKGCTLSYGWSPEADWQVTDIEFRSGEVRFTYRCPDPSRYRGSGSEAQTGRRVMVSRLAGRHNVSNALSVIAAASIAGLSPDPIQEALLAFQGVKRRQEVLGEHRGILVMEDFAHHPTAVRETIEGLRRFYPERRLVVAFEPRTNSSRRRVFQEAYAQSFDEADCICIKIPPGLETIPPEDRMDANRLAEDIRNRNKEAHCFHNAEDLLAFLVDHSARGDLVVCMSNGSFDGVPRKLLERIQLDIS